MISANWPKTPTAANSLKSWRLLKNVLLLPLCLLTLFGCDEDPNKKKPIPYKGPIEEVNNVEVLYSEAAVRKVKLTTEKQITFGSEDKIFPKPITIYFYDPLGNPITTLTSDSGRFEKGKNLYKVMGHVLVVNTLKGETLKTEELYWNPSTQKVYNEKPVEIILKNGDIYQGIGMDAKQDFSNTVIRKITGILSAPTPFGVN